MKRIFCAMLCGLLLTTLSACGGSKQVPAETETPQETETPAEAPEEEPQMSLTSLAQAALADKLRAVEPDTLTPIEALSLLYQLHKEAREAAGE